jgi:hypothetical protein
MLVLLVACGGSGAATEMPDDGFFELDNFTLDGIVFSTREPLVPEALSQAEAQARLPFTLPLAAEAPVGFVLLDRVEVVAPETVDEGEYASAILTWENAAGDQVQLQVSAGEAARAPLGAAGDGQAVSVNGAPGTLVEARGLGPARLTLSWSRAGLDYRLAASSGTLDGAALLAMAESIA